MGNQDKENDHAVDSGKRKIKGKEINQFLAIVNNIGNLIRKEYQHGADPVHEPPQHNVTDPQSAVISRVPQKSCRSPDR